MIELYDSLICSLGTARENFSIYDEEVKVLLGEKAVPATEKRARKRKRHYDESEEEEEETFSTAEESFKNRVFFYIIDNFTSELTRRKQSYGRVFQIFNVLFNFRALSGIFWGKNMTLTHPFREISGRQI